MITKTVHPYEFLARWDAAGSFQGAHFRMLTTYTDDQTGAVMFSQEGDPMTVAQAVEAGHNLAAIIASANTPLAAQIAAALQAQAAALAMAQQDQAQDAQVS